jgi:hypothetical protein
LRNGRSRTALFPRENPKPGIAAQAYKEGTLGARARVRLQNSEWFDDLMLLNELDRRGRVRGAVVCDLDEALESLREMNDESET